MMPALWAADAHNARLGGPVVNKATGLINIKNAKHLALQEEVGRESPRAKSLQFWPHCCFCSRRFRTV